MAPSLWRKFARTHGYSALDQNEPEWTIVSESFGIEQSETADGAALLRDHLDFARAVTPPGHVHAIDYADLDTDEVTVYGLRQAGRLMAVGALSEHDSGHLEIKSMHTVENERGRGHGSAMLKHLISESRKRGASRVSLETGTMDAFSPARELYASFGFRKCPPFGEYWENPNSVCMTLELDPDATSSE
jgi:putative acetyltransferase